MQNCIVNIRDMDRAMTDMKAYLQYPDLEQSLINIYSQ